MSGRLNSDTERFNDQKRYPMHRKLGQIHQPDPTGAFVFLDENPWTIDDGLFGVKVAEEVWHNAPAVRHSYGAVLSFADGHAEHWRWFEPHTGKIRGWNDPSAGPKDRDLNRVKDAFARRQ